MESGTNSRCSPWSHLPIDISDEINRKLHLYDQVRFHAVCKNWHVAQYKRNPIDQLLPWIINIPYPLNFTFKLQLYQPSQSHQNRPLVTNTVSLQQFHRDSRQSVRTITYNYGWLLFSISKLEAPCTNFILYSIFTQEIKALPRLHHQPGYHFNFVLFSAEADSPECVLLVLGATHHDRHTVSTLNYGEKEWITKEFDRNCLVSNRSIVVLISGVFYFVNSFGQIASYDITSGVWTNEYVIKHDWTSFRNHKLFQLGGDITCFSYDDFGVFCSLRRFDFSKKVWIEVKSLGDHALFISDHNAFAVSTIGEAGSNGILAGNVYWLTDCHFRVFSWKDGELLKFGNGSWFKKWVINGIYRYKSRYWIEPLWISR